MTKKIIRSLIISSISSIILLFLRVLYSNSFSYGFLIWNLVLAWVPFCISLYFNSTIKTRSDKIKIFIIMGIWLLFFPNAPYIITDFIHLKPKQNIPLWFDLILLMSFTWNGLLLGFISLSNIKDYLRIKYNVIISNLIVILTLLLTSFGIYLGRYLRWNSWDIIIQPVSLITDIIYIITHPFSNSRALGFTLFFALFLITFYYSFQVLLSSGKQAFLKTPKTE